MVVRQEMVVSDVFKRFDQQPNTFSVSADFSLWKDRADLHLALRPTPGWPSPCKPA
jgi:hypothetical protein